MVEKAFADASAAAKTVRDNFMVDIDIVGVGNCDLCGGDDCIFAPLTFYRT